MNSIFKLPEPDLSIIYGKQGTGKTIWARTCHRNDPSILHTDVRVGYYGANVGEMVPKHDLFEELGDNIKVVIFDGAIAKSVVNALDELKVKGLKIIFLCQEKPQGENVPSFPIEEFLGNTGVRFA